MSPEPSDLLERERRVFTLLAEVCEVDPEARERALAACGDRDLAAEVRRKLEAQTSAVGWLDDGPASDPPELQPIQIGERIGPFEIRGLLGEGGMGQVFRARQRQPVRRDVALKIVRLGRLQADAKVRFDAERQAMARLDHPNIGRILEAGTTEAGQPYFAMELIDGPPITTYCDRAGLSIEQRLRLFLQVCRGTQRYAVARARQLDGKALSKRLRGDLDSLLMKALEPEPTRRYESAAELADDIERHLASEPVLARSTLAWPDSASSGKVARSTKVRGCEIACSESPMWLKTPGVEEPHPVTVVVIPVAVRETRMRLAAVIVAVDSDAVERGSARGKPIDKGLAAERIVRDFTETLEGRWIGAGGLALFCQSQGDFQHVE